MDSHGSRGLYAARAVPEVGYFPVGESTVAGGGYYNNLTFLIRSRTMAEATTAYRAALARYAPTTGYTTFVSLPDQIAQSLGSERLIALLNEVRIVVPGGVVFQKAKLTPIEKVKAVLKRVIHN
jgi:hypothetical protein